MKRERERKRERGQLAMKRETKREREQLDMKKERERERVFSCLTTQINSESNCITTGVTLYESAPQS